MNTVAWSPNRHLLAFAGDARTKREGEILLLVPKKGGK
jgi:hypothetical protein